MNRNNSQIYNAQLFCFTIAFHRLTKLNCRNCRSPLDLHQPNQNQPDQFLYTCPGCDCWFLVQAIAGESHATVVQLPEMSEIRPPVPASDLTS